MREIIYLGYLVSPEEANVASGASVAGNKMQWNAVVNLSKNKDTRVHCITVTPYAAFPRDKMIFHKKRIENLQEDVVSERIGYLNLPVLKQFWQICGVYRAAKKQLKAKPTATVFCFNMFPQVGIPVRWIKKCFPKCQAVCLLADLPLDDCADRKGISSLLRRLFDKSTLKSMTACDKYIVLNKAVSEKYLPGKPYIVVDGGVEEADISRACDCEYIIPNEKNILFCGALTEYNGILNLIEAMKNLKDTDVVLDIYGGGYLEKAVKKAADENDNIRFFGRVANTVVMQKQREAWLLINPRVVDDPIAEVTFPSKTFEYLLSGKPVITTRLNAYSPEYDGLMLFAEDDTPSGLEKIIRKARGEKPQALEKMADDAREFVVHNRSWEVQAKKIYDFMFEV